MNVRPTTLGLGPTVRLAAEPDFTIGRLQIYPSTREIAAGNRRQTVEPRVMQVLTVLARANGAVVSRDALIEACWEGRIVSEDAINRSIAKVRALADIGGGPVFAIETVTRVGYRLRPLGSNDANASIAVPPLLEKSGPVEPSAQANRVAGLTVYRAWPFVLAAMAGVGVTVLAMRGSIAPQSPSQPQWRIVQSQLLVSTPLVERSPAISPDGKMIAYSAGQDAVRSNFLGYLSSISDTHRRIFLRNLSGGEPLALTNDPFPAVSPAWSPDGTQIVYYGYVPGQPCRIMLTAVPAGPSREVTRCSHNDAPTLRWSAKRHALFFDDSPSKAAPSRIVQFDLATETRRDVTRPRGFGDYEPALSPDGRWVSFRRVWSETESGIVICDLRSGAERVVTRTAGFRNGAWTEDSRALLLTSNRGARDFGIWTAPIDGGQPVRLTSGPFEYGRLATGPTGLLAAEVEVGKLELAMKEAGRSAAITIAITGQQQVGSPAFGRDGALAFGANLSGQPGIWVRWPDGRLAKIADLDSFSFRTFDGLWFSPNGSEIGYVTTVNGRRAIRIVTSNGADIGVVRFWGSGITAPAWSGDGRAMLFGGRDAKGWRIWKAALAQPQRIVPITNYGWQSVLARGNELYGTRADAAGVWRIDGMPRQLTRLPAAGDWQDWSLRNDQILYIDQLGGRAPQIIGQPVDGGSPHVIADVPQYQDRSGFDVDPHTGAVAYVVNRSDTDIELFRLQ